MPSPITELKNRNKNDVFGPEERGSVSTYTVPYALSGFCGRYVNFETESRARKETSELVEPHFARGTIVHKYYEHYHQDPTQPMPKFDLGPEYIDGLEEANRYWAEYKKVVPRSALGPTIFSERSMPRTKEERKVVESAVGGVTFKFICDSIVELDKDQIKTLQSIDPTLQLPGAGIYITDLKTEARTQQAAIYELGVQATAYFTAINALRDEGHLPELPTFQPLMGTLFIRLLGIKDPKKPKVIITYVPAPDLNDVLAMQNFFRWRQSQIVGNIANYEACKGNWKRPCWYYTNGACNRGGTWT